MNKAQLKAEVTAWLDSDAVTETDGQVDLEEVATDIGAFIEELEEADTDEDEDEAAG